MNNAPNPAPTALPVFEFKGKLVADSRDVAALIDRPHYDLLKSIRRYCQYLTKGGISVSAYFSEATYIDPTGRELPCYYCTEMGCDMVANKQDGERGTIFTAQYVKAFHAMRDELARRKVLRLEGKPIRRSLTDALRDSGEVERMKGHAYGTYTNLAYKLATGKTAGQLRKERGARKDARAVDFLTAAELEAYQRKESAIAVLLDAGLVYDSIKAVLSGGVTSDGKPA